jgi:hypothetical protein
MSRTLRFANRCAYIALTALAAGEASAQVTFFVQEPASLVGAYPLAWANPADGWLTPDLNDPANSITDTLAFAYDGSSADSLCCDTISGVINDVDIAGKIAVCYRGTCNFSLKAWMCQRDGAVGVVIINNAPGVAINPVPGLFGDSVTVPVVIIGQAEGALLHDEIEAGNVVAFIGNPAGNFPNNLTIYKRNILMPSSSARPDQICADATEFNFTPGSWVHNIGINDQTGVTVNCVITENGTTVYDETSSPQDILAGDSAQFSLPVFSQSSYGGYYEVEYTAASGVTDDFPGDDSFGSNLLIDSLFAYGRIDEATELPVLANFYQPSGVASDFQTCVHFSDPNGSRLGVTGLHVAITANAADSVTGELVEVYAYEWNDVFTGLSDANIDVTDINQVAQGEYTFNDNSLEGQSIFVPFADAIALADDQRYLFCIKTYSADLFHGFDDGIDYWQNWNFNDQPTTVINDGTAWFVQGFGSDVQSAIGARMIDADMVGVLENDFTGDVVVTPNPSRGEFLVTLKGLGTVQLELTDLTGRVVRSVRTSAPTVSFDLTREGAGVYLLNVRDEKGFKTMKVVVH